MTDERSYATALSPWWRHSAILVMIVGFTILSIVTVKTYDNAPPIAARVVDGAGRTIFTSDDILRGQEVFLKYGLMEHGTLWGHGAYLGPDYTAEYLHRLAEISRDTLAIARYGKSFAALDAGLARDVGEAVRAEAKENRYDPATETLRFSAAEATAFSTQQREWGEYFGGARAAPGLPPRYIRNPAELDALAAYFGWATWATVANRPGKDYSYTNNWPYEPLVGNRPTASTYLWSALSLVTLLGGLGLVLLAFGKFNYLGWRGEESTGHRHDSRLIGWQLTPSQRATRFFLAVVAVLFLLQTLAGGALAHYRVEPGAFYGFDLARWLPYNLLRTWHLDRLGNLWFWFGHQGSEYLDLGRFWQLLLAAGLVFWLVLMFRALRPAMQRPHDGTLASLFLYAAVAIPVFYLPALFYGPHTNFAVIDNWRFWIIHLWVEGFFELFATVLVAVMFSQMGLVTATTATRIVYLDAILYLGAGIVGTGHHWYFTGQGTLNMGLAACFSAMEVVPLTLLTLDAWDFVSLQDRRCADCGHAFAAQQTWAIYFLMAVGFWNFVGAGIFGFLINLPIVSYFEVGTLLTSNHGHAAMFGVFGMLALAVVVFCLRTFADDARWQRVEGLIRTGFWGLNVGLGLMVLLDLFPGGVLQLWDVLSNGYWHARRLAFLTSGTFHMLEWARIGADMVFLVIGVVPIVVATLRITLSPASAEPNLAVAPGGGARAVV